MQADFRAIRAIRLTHCIGLLVITFVLLTLASGTLIWRRIADLEKSQADIINRQYPARVALGEAKASEGVFGVLAYQLKDAKPDDIPELRTAVREEARRFRNWLETVRSLCPEVTGDITATSQRFEQIRSFLDEFPKAGSETPQFQLDYRFSPLRDDLEASLTRISLDLRTEVEDKVAYAQDVQSASVLRAVELFAAGFVLFFVGALAWTSFAVARPMLKLAASMRQIAGGDNAASIRYTKREDEVGEIARAIVVFRDKALSVKRLEQETVETEIRAAEALSSERARVVEVFQLEVMEAIAALSSATQELQCNAMVMRDLAGATDERAKTVVSFSQNRMETTENLFSSSADLTETISQMNTLFTSAGQIATMAIGDGNATSRRAKALVEAVDTIGQIADFIGGVAYQTNLLALNATIEAARCGEAGRGFAVVAQEVKTLAHETSRAAADIAQRLGTVREATDHVVSAIGVTVSRIGRIAEMSDHLSEAIDQKDRASQAISRCVVAAGKEAQNLSIILQDVGHSTNETQRVASEILLATNEVSRYSERLLHRSREFCQQINVETAEPLRALG